MIPSEKKILRYERIFEQLKPLLQTGPTFDAKLATINAVLYHKIKYIFWAGFYLLSDNKLCVNSYQGPLACQELEYPKGVCWKSIINKTSIVVPDVEKFDDHIACDSRSKSEIVIPLYDAEHNIYGVFDADSDMLNAFDENDEKGLRRILGLLNM